VERVQQGKAKSVTKNLVYGQQLTF